MHISQDQLGHWIQHLVTQSSDKTKIPHDMVQKSTMSKKNYSLGLFEQTVSILSPKGRLCPPKQMNLWRDGEVISDQKKFVADFIVSNKHFSLLNFWKNFVEDFCIFRKKVVWSFSENSSILKGRSVPNSMNMS